MFDNRKDAGEKLGRALEKYRDKGVLVLAIPKGGVEVGYEVTKYLNAEFSIIISRKLPFPDNPESGFGAVAEDGSMFIFDFAKDFFPPEMIDSILSEQRSEIERRIAVLRKGKPLPEIKGRTVILVDDGIAMGSTMRASLFLKPRYGSMGKGITFLSRAKWETNFTFDKNKIISQRSDHGWIFNDITGNDKFLKKLLKEDILVQEAIAPPVLNGNIVDLRIYTFFNKVIYVYPRKNARNKITTNISQGGQGDPKLLKLLPKDFIKKAKREAVRVSSALNIGLAGIDIIPDRNYKNVHVIDVNVFSGFPKKKMFNIARRLARELDRLNSREKLYFMQGG